MSEDLIADDQSHYEVSLTAGQAFLAFVLLLLSLAASFAFGLMIGRSHGDERLLAQSSPSIVDEPGVTPKKAKQRIVELGITEDSSFSEPGTKPEMVPPKSTSKSAPPLKISEEPLQLSAAMATPATAEGKPEASGGPEVAHYAQLLSTTDQKKAETLAASLIDAGFSGAYVERTRNDRGPLFRVRVNFPSEQAARGAETKLRTFSKDVWITRQ